jgi:hypothetical protein
MITLKCGACGKLLEIADEYQGKTGKCYGCGGPISVPYVQAAPIPATPQAPYVQAAPIPSTAPVRKRFGCGKGCLVLVCGFLILMVIGSIGAYQDKAALARADGLWLEGKQADAVSIYTHELMNVDDANKPEVFTRIVTQLYDSGDREGATDYYNKAMEEGIHIEFTHNDLRRFFDKAGEAVEAPKKAELAVEAENSELSVGTESGQFKLEQAPLAQGMTYSEVNGIIGWEGTERGSLAGPDDSKTTAYKWDDEEGSLVASFRDNALDKWDYSKRKIQRVEENQQAEAQRTEAESTPKVYSQGKTVGVGYTAYTVWRSWWSDRLSENEFLDERPNAMFLFVELSVRNDDKKARMVPPFTLVDENGAEYEASSAGWVVEGSIGVLESLNPSVSKQGSVVFDVPTGHRYHLKLSGGYWSIEDAYVQLTPQ